MIHSAIRIYNDENKELKHIIKNKNEDISGLDIADKMKKETIIN